MNVMNIHEAKTHFSKLIQQVLRGEEIIIAKGGEPLIRLVPYQKEIIPRKGGQFKGLMTIKENFDDPLPEDLLSKFYEN